MGKLEYKRKSNIAREFNLVRRKVINDIEIRINNIIFSDDITSKEIIVNEIKKVIQELSSEYEKEYKMELKSIMEMYGYHPTEY